jgi:hypothetical protein
MSSSTQTLTKTPIGTIPQWVEKSPYKTLKAPNHHAKSIRIKDIWCSLEIFAPKGSILSMESNRIGLWYGPKYVEIDDWVYKVVCPLEKDLYRFDPDKRWPLAGWSPEQLKEHEESKWDNIRLGIELGQRIKAPTPEWNAELRAAIWLKELVRQREAALKEVATNLGIEDIGIPFLQKVTNDAAMFVKLTQNTDHAIILRNTASTIWFLHTTGIITDPFKTADISFSNDETHEHYKTLHDIQTLRGTIYDQMIVIEQKWGTDDLVLDVSEWKELEDEMNNLRQLAESVETMHYALDFLLQTQ